MLPNAQHQESSTTWWNAIIRSEGAPAPRQIGFARSDEQKS